MSRAVQQQLADRSVMVGWLKALHLMTIYELEAMLRCKGYRM